MTNAQKILTATLAGAAAGMIAGILIAPDKGSATRQRIADTTRKVSDNVKEFTNNAASTINGMKDKLFKKKDEVFQGDESSFG